MFENHRKSLIFDNIFVSINAMRKFFTLFLKIILKMRYFWTFSNTLWVNYKEIVIPGVDYLERSSRSS